MIVFALNCHVFQSVCRDFYHPDNTLKSILFAWNISFCFLMNIYKDGNLDQKKIPKGYWEAVTEYLWTKRPYICPVSRNHRICSNSSTTRVISSAVTANLSGISEINLVLMEFVFFSCFGFVCNTLFIFFYPFVYFLSDIVWYYVFELCFLITPLESSSFSFYAIYV